MPVIFRVLDGKDCLFLEALGFFCGRIEVGNDCASTTIASVEEALEWNTCLREIRRTNISKEMATLEMQEKSAGLQKTREGLFTSIATYAYLEDLAPGKIELDFCQIPSCRFPPFVPHATIVCMGQKVSPTLVTLDGLFKAVCGLVQVGTLSVDQGIALIAAGRKKRMVVSMACLEVMRGKCEISEYFWRLLISYQLVRTLSWVSL